MNAIAEKEAARFEITAKWLTLDGTGLILGRRGWSRGCWCWPALLLAHFGMIALTQLDGFRSATNDLIVWITNFCPLNILAVCA